MELSEIQAIFRSAQPGDLDEREASFVQTVLGWRGKNLTPKMHPWAEEIALRLAGEPEQEYAQQSAETAAQRMLRERQAKQAEPSFEQAAEQALAPRQRTVSVRQEGGALEQLVSDAKHQIEQALPEDMRQDVDWLCRRALLYFATSDSFKLKNCSPESKLQCILSSAAVGLPLDGDKAYAIPYKEVAKFAPSYKGLIEIAKNDPEISDIRAFVVRENDDYSREIIDGKEVRKHIFAPLNQRGETIGAYATIYLADGTTHTEEMDLDDLQAVAECSEMWDKENGKPKDTKGVNMWRDFPDQARKKSAVRRLCNTYVSSRNKRYAEAITLDNQHYTISGPKERALVPQGQQSVFAASRETLRQNSCMEIMGQIEAAERDPEPLGSILIVERNIQAAHAAGKLTDQDRDELLRRCGTAGAGV